MKKDKVISRILARFELIALLPALLWLTGCSESITYEPVNVSGVIWGTTYSITVNGAQVPDSCDIESVITDALATVDTIANAFSQTSVVSRFNREGTVLNPPAHMVAVLRLAENVSALTGNAFDPTVGPLVNLWGFGTTGESAAPTDEKVDSVRALVGMDKIKIEADEITALVPGVRLDLAAIAKGMGVDVVAQALGNIGVTDYMVEIGGEVRVGGLSPRGDRWKIQLDAPIHSHDADHYRLAILGLENVAVATSGDYRNFVENANGEIYCHIISPQTGKPVKTDIGSATVFATTTAFADALATASMVMGLEKAAKLIEELAANAEPQIYGAIFVKSGSGTPEAVAVCLDSTCVGIESAEVSFRYVGCVGAKVTP